MKGCLFKKAAFFFLQNIFSINQEPNKLTMKSPIYFYSLLKNENKSKPAILRLAAIKSFTLLIVLVLIKCIFITGAIAQVPPVVEWDARFGGSADEGMYTVRPTSDGGYIAGGASWSGVSGQKTKENKGQTDYWIVKMDGDGVKLAEIGLCSSGVCKASGNGGGTKGITESFQLVKGAFGLLEAGRVAADVHA